MRAAISRALGASSVTTSLPSRTGRVYLGAGQTGNRLRDSLHAFRNGVNDDPGNVEFFAHEDSGGEDQPPVGGPLMTWNIQTRKP